MNLTPQFTGSIQDGKLKLFAPERFKQFIASLSRPESPVKVNVSIKKLRYRRTTGAYTDPSNQNGYLFGVVLPILGDYFGYDTDEMYHALEVKFSRIGGTDDLPKVKKFKKLDKNEWEEKMEKIRIWAQTEYDIKIPLPNESL